MKVEAGLTVQLTVAFLTIKSQDSDDARTARASAIIERQVRHMTKLVDDPLNVSRVTRGLILLHVETLELVVAVASASAIQALSEAQFTRASSRSANTRSVRS